MIEMLVLEVVARLGIVAYAAVRINAVIDRPASAYRTSVLVFCGAAVTIALVRL